MWFDAGMGGDNRILQAIPDSCKVDDMAFSHNKIKFLKLTGSKIYENFRFHQIAFLTSMLIMPFAYLRRITWLNFFHYSVVILFGSPYFQRYTFMIELTLIAVILKLYEEIS
jgi:hypothetical protein